MIDANGVAKIADFGLSTICRSGSSMIVYPSRDDDNYDNKKCNHCFVGTSGYFPPEMTEKKDYNTKADIWSFGVLCHKLLMRFGPFVIDCECDRGSSGCNCDPAGVNTNKLTRKNQLIHLQEDTYLSQEATDFVFLLLQREPTACLSAKNILKHPWITLYVHETNMGDSDFFEHNFHHFYHEEDNQRELLSVFKTTTTCKSQHEKICQNNGRYLLKFEEGGSYVLLKVHDGVCYLKKSNESDFRNLYKEVGDLGAQSEAVKSMRSDEFGSPSKWRVERRNIMELLSVKKSSRLPTYNMKCKGERPSSLWPRPSG